MESTAEKVIATANAAGASTTATGEAEVMTGATGIGIAG
jgi:hypothetical protein